MSVAGQPVLSFLDGNKAPLSNIALQKTGAPSNAIPAGQTSDAFGFHVCNNLNGLSATGDFYDATLAVYNDTSNNQPPYEEPVQPTAGGSPWLQVQQLGYGTVSGGVFTETITRGVTAGYSAIPYKAIGGGTKIKIYTRKTDAQAPSEPAVGDTLPGDAGGTFFRLQCRLVVPVDTAVTQVAVGLWLEGNYVA